MYKLKRSWLKQLNRVLTLNFLHYFRACFLMFFSCASIFYHVLRYILKEKFFGLSDNHQYVFSSGILLDTLFLHSICILFGRLGMSWFNISFSLLHLQLIGLFRIRRGGKGLGRCRFLQLYLC